MRPSDSLSLIGTIRTLELETLASRFAGVPSREVSKMNLDLEAAHNVDGAPQNLENLQSLTFRGPAELVARFSVGDRVAIETAGGFRIGSIKKAPLS